MGSFLSLPGSASTCRKGLSLPPLLAVGRVTEAGTETAQCRAGDRQREIGQVTPGTSPPNPSRCPALIRLCPLTVKCTVTPLPRVSAVPRAGNGHAMGKQELRPTPRCQSRARDEPWAAARGDTDSSLYGRSQTGGHPGDSVPLRYPVEPGFGGGSRMRGRAEPLWGELAPGAGLSHLLLGGGGCEGPAPRPLHTCRPRSHRPSLCVSQAPHLRTRPGAAASAGALG